MAQLSSSFWLPVEVSIPLFGSALGKWVWVEEQVIDSAQGQQQRQDLVGLECQGCYMGHLHSMEHCILVGQGGEDQFLEKVWLAPEDLRGEKGMERNAWK